MPSNRPLSLITDERSLSQAWIDACAGDEALPDPLDLEAAARFLGAMATALHAEAAGAIDPDFEPACRTFAWSSGSVDRAVRQLAALRMAIKRVLAGTAPHARDTVDHLLDRAIIAVVRHTTEELERDALVDPLTGLLNRRALLRNLEGELGRAARAGVGFCVVFLDVDGLKRVNDRQGHRAGDATLVRLADALSAALRRGDTAYRIGGDEFVAVLPATARDSVGAFVQRLVDAGAPCFSWGEAAHPDDAATVDDLLEIADSRLMDRRRIQR